MYCFRTLDFHALSFILLYLIYSYPLAIWPYLVYCYMSWFCGFAYSDSETWNEVDPSTEDQEYFSEQADQL